MLERGDIFVIDGKYCFAFGGARSHDIQDGILEIDDLNRYLESLRDIMKYDQWFFGHLHDNRQVFESDYLLYEQIIRIS